MPHPVVNDTSERTAKQRRAGVDPPICKQIELRGRVQGLGLRPTIARQAKELGLVGNVCNSASGVDIVVEGQRRDVESFVEQLPQRLPDHAILERLVVVSRPLCGASEFTISASQDAGERRVFVPVDLVVCSECLGDVRDPNNRRAAYVFTTCTTCGPRYSIIERMPYDRASTTMTPFVPCAACGREYADPHDRRFHSQTNSCPACGPRIWATDGRGQILGESDAAIQAAVDLLRAGQVVAIQGLGGYQLLADGTSRTTVQELRSRKMRRGKPLAVLVGDLAGAERLALLSPAERELLESAANPIVVARRRQPSPLADSLVEGLHTVGVMLPSSPLHALLAELVGVPLVVTSGNAEGVSLVYRQEEAGEYLHTVAACVLHNDRRIRRPVDDSVAQLIAGKQATLRLGRGLAPLPLRLTCNVQLVALGGHQKSAIALSNGAQAVLGPHIGDLEQEAARVRFVEQFAELCQLYGTRPEVLVHDEHPDYFTSRWAEAQHLPTIRVQHHHAHVVAAMLEHGWLDRTVLGIAWDGTGYGPDGTVWGGEFLQADSSRYERLATLLPFILPSAERAVREPWRVATAVVQQALGSQHAAALAFPGISPQEVQLIVGALARSHGWPASSSAGRLFDAVAALVIGQSRCDFEGQAAMLLEAACDHSAAGEYPFPLRDDAPAMLDWRPLICGVLDDLARDVARGTIAMRFHRSLAGGIARLATRYPELPIVLCGGCFYNRVLTELVVGRIGSGRQIGTPGVIPVGDGGLAAGQLAVAAARIAGETSCA